MMRNRFWTLSLVMGLVTLFAAGPVFADARDELKERFKQRFPQLLKLKEAGKIGELHTGYIAVVKPEYAKEKLEPEKEDSITVGQFVDLENTDRAKLYAILAKELKVDVQTIAERNAVRNFDNAQADWYLKPQGRDWIRKKDLDKEKKQ